MGSPLKTVEIDLFKNEHYINGYHLVLLLIVNELSLISALSIH